jgi:nucleotide-binding universal stress UspA family protein
LHSNAVLHLAQVVSWISDLTDMSSPRSPRRYLNRIADGIRREYAISVETDLLSDAINGVDYGEPPRRAIAEVLDEYLVREEIELVVMTTHGRGGVRRLWLGSVADSLLRMSTVSILMLKAGHVTRAKSHAAPRRILVAVDARNLDEELVARTVELGELYDAQYTLLHVAPPTLTLVPALYDAELETAARKSAESHIRRIAETLEETGHSVAVEVVEMPFVASEILAYSVDHKFDLIAISTRGPGWTSRMVMGSVADKVIRGSTLPIFAFKAIKSRKRT